MRASDVGIGGLTEDDIRVIRRWLDEESGVDQLIVDLHLLVGQLSDPWHREAKDLWREEMRTASRVGGVLADMEQILTQVLATKADPGSDDPEQRVIFKLQRNFSDGQRIYSEEESREKLENLVSVLGLLRENFNFAYLAKLDEATSRPKNTINRRFVEQFVKRFHNAIGRFPVIHDRPRKTPLKDWEVAQIVATRMGWHQVSTLKKALKKEIRVQKSAVQDD